MSASLVTDKEIDNFTLTVIQSEPLIQNNCVRIQSSYEFCFDLVCLFFSQI